MLQTGWLTLPLPQYLPSPWGVEVFLQVSCFQFLSFKFSLWTSCSSPQGAACSRSLLLGLSPTLCCPVNSRRLALVSGLKTWAQILHVLVFHAFSPHCTPTAPWKCLMAYPLCAFILFSDSLQSLNGNLTVLLFGLKFSNEFPLHLL